MNNKSENIYLEVGKWHEGSTRPLRDPKLTGRIVGRVVVYHDYEAGRFYTTYWRLYHLDDGRYLLWWRDCTAPRGWTNIADYAVLDELPVPGETYEGTRTYKGKYYQSQPVPAELVAQAREGW